MIFNCFSECFLDYSAFLYFPDPTVDFPGPVLKRKLLPATTNNSFAPSLNYICVRPRIKFDGQCLKQDNVIFTH